MSQHSSTPSFHSTPSSAIFVTAFSSITNPRPVGEVQFAELAALAAEFGHPRVTEDKHAVPLYLPGILRAGTTRANESVLALTAFVADVDDALEADLLRALGRLDRRGVEHLVHSTWGHADAIRRGRVRARIIIPLERPVPGVAWPTTWRRMQTFLGGICDPQCCDPARAYYVPSTPRRGTNSAYVRHVPGRRFAP